jgi:1-phosphofructokinase family hexose kinase
MILTLTPNPSLDLLFSAERLAWDDANRIAAPRRRPGGQGINVVRAVRELGGSATALAPLGGRVGEELGALLEREGTPLRRVPIRGETRLFVGVREVATGRSLLLNPRGPELAPQEAESLFDAAVAALDELQPAWLACCGSVPPGVSRDLYARLAHEAQRRSVRFVVDCDGEALRRAAEAGCTLLVPNAHEAGRLLNRPVAGVEAAAAAARELVGRGCGVAAVTLGSDGAVLASGAELWHCVGDRVDHGSAVGAGDAFLAALLLALEDGTQPADALRAAVAAGTAVLRGKDEALLQLGDAEAIAQELRLVRLPGA